MTAYRFHWFEFEECDLSDIAAELHYLLTAPLDDPPRVGMRHPTDPPVLRAREFHQWLSDYPICAVLGWEVLEDTFVFVEIMDDTHAVEATLRFGEPPVETRFRPWCETPDAI